MNQVQMIYAIVPSASGILNSGEPPRYGRKMALRISEIGRKVKGVKIAIYLVLSPKKCQHI